MAYDVFYETSDEETRVHFLEGLQLGAHWAGQSGVMLGLENLDTPFVDSLGKALTIINEINSPWLQLYPDIGNLTAAGHFAPEELALAKGKVLGIHVKDALPQVIRGVPFEKGIVPFQDSFRALADIGFWGMLGVEMWGEMHADEGPMAAAIAARKLVDNLVAETWPTGQPLSLHMEDV
jgi:L-ribulose-5-phosphate 3-epimerase UlaE